MTIGDVLATVAGVVAFCASLWAALLVTLLLFPARTGRASERIEQQPWRCLGMGTLVSGTAGVIAVVLLNQPNGFFKLLGWVALALLLGLATVGSAGLSMVVAKRIRASDADVPPLRASGYGAGLLVASGVLPVLGWMIFLASLLTSLGAGALTTARQRKGGRATKAAPAPAPVPIPAASGYAHE
ncbi:MAG: hypothetical protein H7Z41_14695 [Cytophagales bacterium]|nr:hypothetical protein [Armatimonadota bacterium]